MITFTIPILSSTAANALTRIVCCSCSRISFCARVDVAIKRSSGLQQAQVSAVLHTMGLALLLKVCALLLRIPHTFAFAVTSWKRANEANFILTLISAKWRLEHEVSTHNATPFALQLPWDSWTTLHFVEEGRLTISVWTQKGKPVFSFQHLSFPKHDETGRSPVGLGTGVPADTLFGGGRPKIFYKASFIPLKR